MDVLTLGNLVPKRGNKFTQFIGKCIFKIWGWRIIGEIPNVPKAVVVIAPHTSNWDFVIGMATIFAQGIHSNWMGKHTLFRWPFRGVMNWLGGIPVDRTAPHGVVEQMVQVFQKRKQIFLSIAPEGTRKKVKKWKTGFYYIALGAQVPILLVAFDYGKKVVKFGPTLFPSGNIEKDIEKIQSHYRNIEGKYPQHFSKI